MIEASYKMSYFKNYKTSAGSTNSMQAGQSSQSAGNLPDGKAGFGNGSRHFSPKKPIRSFRDLEVYQKSVECSVLIESDVLDRARKFGYAHCDAVSNCALSVPLLVAEAHSLRFADFALALGFLEKAMSACNKTVAYLDQIRGIYGEKVGTDLLEDIAGRYVLARLKMFRLEKSWRKFMDKDTEGEVAGNRQ